MNLYVETHGRGPDLVLLHGWGLNLRVWDGLTRELSRSFRVIAVDLPGHGRSAWNPKARTPAEQAWQVHATVASLSDRYSLLGWSLGGQIALDLAAAMPGSVERLILVAATPRFAANADWPYGMPSAALDKLATQLRTNYKRTVSEFLELQVRGSAASDKVLAELHGSLFSHGEAHPKALVAGLSTLKSSDLRSLLTLVRAPTLVIAGQYDRVTLPAASRALAQALPAAQYVEFRRAAHAPFLSHTTEFAALVTRFLRGEAVDGPAADAPSASAAAEREAPANRGVAATNSIPTSAVAAAADSAAGSTIAVREATAANRGNEPTGVNNSHDLTPTMLEALAADSILTSGEATRGATTSRAPTAARGKRAARKRSRTSSS